MNIKPALAVIFFTLFGLGVLYHGLSGYLLAPKVYASEKGFEGVIGQVKKALLADKKSLPFQENETITYTIKLRGLSIGRAALTYKGIAELEGKKVHCVVFTTDTVNFKDTETMYADIDNFLPLKIQRDINNWGKKISIIEEYDQANNSIKITRLNNHENIVKEIKQDDKIQNVILSTFLRRKTGDFVLGGEFPVTLPLNKIIMRITKDTSVQAPYGTYAAHLLESFPKGYQIWFESSPKHIPVKISGPFMLGKVVMVMTDYKEK